MTLRPEGVLCIGNCRGVLCTCAVVLFKWMFFAKHQYLSAINQKRTTATALHRPSTRGELAHITRHEKNARRWSGVGARLPYLHHYTYRGTRPSWYPTHTLQYRYHCEFILMRHERWTNNFDKIGRYTVSLYLVVSHQTI